MGGHDEYRDSWRSLAAERPPVHGRGTRLLAVEVHSPGTAIIDLNRKKAAYEKFGVASYWIVVPDPGSPALIAFDLHDGHYIATAHITGGGTHRAIQPFPVEISPASLVAGLRIPR